MQKQPTDVLILAGGDIRKKFFSLKMHCACPALLPINTRPLGAYVIESYRNQPHKQSETDFRIFLVVDRSFISEVQKELPPAEYAYTLLGVEPSEGVISSLEQATNSIEDLFETVIINLVTTVPTKLPEKNTVFLAKEDDLIGEWSSVRREGKNTVFLPKKSQVTQHGKGEPFTGVFSLGRESLKQALSTCDDPKDLLSLIRAVYQEGTPSPLSFETIQWLDSGHEINYLECRAALINSRSFNQLNVDPTKGVIWKNSEEKEKIYNEAAYVEMLPKALQTYFPRILQRRSSAKGDQLDAYAMEYYGYPNLAEYLLYWDLEKSAWKRTFSRVKEALYAFHAHPFSIGKAEFRDFLWGKTMRRIASFKTQAKNYPWGEGLFSKELTINGEKMPSADVMLAELSTQIDGLYREEEFSVFHGDFCFNNILYDMNSGIIRLIDPRGAFSARTVGIYGDRRYDLAKFIHSSIGGYDYIVNGLFHCQWEGEKKLTLDLNLRPNHAMMCEFSENLIEDMGASSPEIKRFVSLLFFSMLPLHQENPKRQLAFFLRGVKLLHEALSD